MADEICSGCGRPLPPKFQVTGWARVSLVRELTKVPHGITRAQLANRIYNGCRDGGSNDLAICQLVHQARLQLIPQGYTIKSNRGPGAHYRLVKL
jgi:hypothetical protein